ncbi:Glyco-hydro-cc domain-containing protein [Mycena indigotica]|uniref:Glyco-hydro-cc domain-containing protein n=1 Tax=Mycena indigotica TaxID=2126181 RepID=A0A8H6S471_9AGAR|nr:Glyco-hydro-cc domain-containing protein [Mycena indigotica]KAF7292850.1 Glyco-hydro-cc domain-containing protein [Mycena indigotica]
MPPDFDNKEYWQQRFAHETAFEWLVSSTDFMRVLEPYLEKLPKAARILHLGIGTSELHNHLRMLGFSDITNIDYEPMAIERSKQLEEKAFGDVRMQYLVADVTELESDRLRGGLFDLVVDKSTADAVSCGGEEAIARMARAVRRCLGDGGMKVLLWLQLLAIQQVLSLYAPRGSPKRGVALVASSNADLGRTTHQQCSWVYNWSPTPPPLMPTGLTFVPMQWGRDNVHAFADAVHKSGARTILAFNEPDMASQSNLAVGEAAELWQQYIQPLKKDGVRLGSPAISSAPSGLQWLQAFLQVCSGCTVDFIAVHWYGEGASNFIQYLQSVHAQFPNKPIRVTEFAATSSRATDVSTFMNDALTYLDSQSWIEGYSWFAFARAVPPLQTNLLDGGGSLNALGLHYM